MSQRRRPTQRRHPSSPPASQQQNKAPVLYIVVISVMVFALLVSGLAAVDWGAFFPVSDPETPDVNIDQIAIQQAIVAQNPDDAEAQELLASMLANSGRIDEAIPVYEEAVRLDPENGVIRRNFAMSLQQGGLINDAEVQFERAIEINPDDHSAHYYLARLYLDWQPVRQGEAIEHFERVIEIAPNSFLAGQAQDVLESLGPSTPIVYIATPIASPTYAE